MLLKSQKKTEKPSLYSLTFIMNKLSYYLKLISDDLALSKKYLKIQNKAKSQSHICSCSHKYMPRRQRWLSFIIIGEAGPCLFRLSLALSFSTSFILLYTFILHRYIHKFDAFATGNIGVTRNWRVAVKHTKQEKEKIQNFTLLKWEKRIKE